VLLGLAAPIQGGDKVLPAYGPCAHILIGLAATALVLPAVAMPASRRAGLSHAPLTLLCHPTVAWVGTVSYGIYLWHETVLRALSSLLGLGSATLSIPLTVVLFVGTVAGAIAVGAGSWYLVERPAERRWRPRARPAVALAS
jgi:peptidoglycan/LPS O-acetylase OafA/YrhL